MSHLPYSTLSDNMTLVLETAAFAILRLPSTALVRSGRNYMRRNPIDLLIVGCFRTKKKLESFGRSVSLLSETFRSAHIRVVRKVGQKIERENAFVKKEAAMHRRRDDPFLIPFTNFDTSGLITSAVFEC